MAQFEDVIFGSPTFKRDPFPYYAFLRKNCPVRQIQYPRSGAAWLVTRYDDVSWLLKDSRFAKDSKNAMTKEQLKKEAWIPPIFSPLMNNMLERDEPDHTRLKKLAQSAFTPGRISLLTEQINAVADSLIEQLLKKESFDLIYDFAMPLPVTVISELLGVPERDRARFARYSKTIIDNDLTPMGILLALPDTLNFLRYLRWLIKEKRSKPQDDLVTALVQAEEAGDQLNGEELMSMIAILLSAGHETTTNLIGNGIFALMQNPEQLEKLRIAPEIIVSGVEELLRFASPVEMSTTRFTREDTEISGTMIPRGSIVIGAIASANRDETQFKEADILDLERKNNKHLSFGQGAHYCIGAALARMEGQVAISKLIERMPHLRLAVPEHNLSWKGGMVLRGLKSLPLTNSA